MFFIRKKKKHTGLKVMVIIFAVIGAFVAIGTAAMLLYKKYQACLAGFDDTDDDLCELEDCDCDCDCCCCDDEVTVEDETEAK